MLLTQAGLKTVPKSLPFHEAESAVPAYREQLSFSGDLPTDGGTGAAV